MQSEKQYIDLYNETQGMIKQHSCDVLNKVRDKAFEDFKRQGFPTKRWNATNIQISQSFLRPIMD